MYKLKKIYNCYQCDYFRRIKDNPLLKDLELNIEGACYNHKDQEDPKSPVAMVIYNVTQEFPNFCGLDDPD